MASVSILIPCYNAGFYLEQAIKSVVGQTYTDWELIVLDDHSTDESYNIALRWQQKDSRIKVYCNKENLGMVDNWNKGISLCQSPLFVKLDADDKWYPTLLEKSIKILHENPEVGLVFTRFEDIDDKGNINKPGVELPHFVRNKSFSCIPLVQQGPDKMLSYNIMLQGLSLIRREIFNKIGGYRFLLTKETQAATDTEFYFRVGAHYKIFFIDEVLYQYRIHNTSLSAIDLNNNLTARKIYEIKYCIVNYYTHCKLISPEQSKAFLKIIKSQYSLVEISQYLHKKQWTKMLKSLIQQLVQNPLSTFSFYSKRIFTKFSNT